MAVVRNRPASRSRPPARRAYKYLSPRPLPPSSLQPHPRFSHQLHPPQRTFINNLFINILLSTSRVYHNGQNQADCPYVSLVPFFFFFGFSSLSHHFPVAPHQRVSTSPHHLLTYLQQVNLPVARPRVSRSPPRLPARLLPLLVVSRSLTATSLVSISPYINI